LREPANILSWKRNAAVDGAACGAVANGGSYYGGRRDIELHSGVKSGAVAANLLMVNIFLGGVRCSLVTEERRARLKVSLRSGGVRGAVSLHFNKFLSDNISVW